MIGNEDFNIIIPNGYGDGETIVYLVDDNVGNLDNMANFFTSFNANDTHIYAEDTNLKKTKINLDGRYGAYYYDGTVIFAKW